jgi:hypothetical protein
VAALRNTSAQLAEMHAVVLRMMCSEFVAVAMGRDGLLADISGASGVLGPAVAAPAARSADPASLADVEDRLLPLALAIVRAGELPALLDEYKQATAPCQPVTLQSKGAPCQSVTLQSKGAPVPPTHPWMC